MDLERETRRGFLKKIVTSVGGGIAAKELLKARPIRAQEAPFSSVDMTEPEVEGVMAEAPLSPVEQLLANTELVDAVYLGNTPVIEFRTQEGELSKLSINPEVSQEERDQLAQLTVPSGQRFGYSSIVILLSPYNEVLEEAKLDNGATLFSSSIRYKGKEINLGLHGSKIIDGKCIVKWGPQNQLRNYIEDPEFTETVINPRARSFIRGILADGGLDLPARQNRDQSVFDTATNLLHNNFFQLS
ncbi:MAG: hypothetical protein US86_C0005G0078 [Candidatus Daviesbacteria bacterium GW2011_GWA2_38_24]|uniref:Uncharacterized protein n=1 Tax=Candidatus Daviesbacteria bacterium GW2011_GWA2_38_24 TaxID=1618422 RepID=A0A0G0JI81_9BACT|nr:MAG: hypothetical protein US86_C0005G0078 [Candidatus Daviesbacteria bacterium GW2011_GWA2_38_24]